MNNFEAPKQGIRKRYRWISYSIILTIMAFSIIFYIYIDNAQKELEEDRKKADKRVMIVDDLANTLNDVILRGRGYFAFKSEYELTLLNNSLKQYEQQIDVFKGLELNKEERILSQEIEGFYNSYRYNVLPLAIKYVQADDYENIRKFADNGSGNPSNNLKAKLESYKVNNQKKMNQLYADLLKTSNNYTMLSIIISTVFIFMLILLVGIVINRVIRPIEQLELATHALADGGTLQLETRKVDDEINRLISAFQNMAGTIQFKEEELITHNEELLAQQDELQAQQIMLTESAKENENMKLALDQSAIVITMDEYHVIRQVNDKCIELMQFTREEVIGKPVTIFRSGDHAVSYYDELNMTVKNGSIWSNNIKNKRKDGSVIWLNATIVPYVNNSGHAYRYIFIGIDMTGAKEAEEEMARLLEMTEETKDRLEKYNELNHDLTYTLDKQELVNSFHDYLLKHFKLDKSLFWLTEERIYQERGLSAEIIKRVIDVESSDILLRLEKEKIFVVTREITIEEQGIAEKPFYAYDLYTSVIGTDDQIVAVYSATRFGQGFSEEEIKLMNGLMQRASLAIGRISMYELVEDARRLNQDIINNVNEGIQFVDQKGNMIQSNATLANKIIGSVWPKEDIIPFESWVGTFLTVCTPQEELREFFQDALSDEPKNTSIQYVINEETFIQLYTSPVFRSGERVGTILVHRDITKEHEIDQMKSELVSTVSHELRTPLSSVLGFTELLLTKNVKEDRQKKYLGTIHKEAKRLTNLINDFLDIQRMESGKQNYDMEAVGINQVAMEVIDKFKLEKNHHIILIDEAKEVSVVGDKDRLHQLLTNILSNAIKFSPKGGQVEIKLKNSEQHLVVSIRDEGLGIKQEDIDKLFHKFKRVDNSASRKIGGTGLGLAISKEIVEKHQGRIWMESKEGAGTTVLFTLPLMNKNRDPGDVTEPTPLPNKGENLNVMLVEDDTSIALLLSEELKTNGFTIIHHANPEQAFKDAMTIPLVAIVVDLMLGDDISGWELIKMLKEKKETKDIPIVISSALDEEVKNVALYKIDKYLTKPYRPEELSNVVHSFLHEDNKKGDVLFPKQDA